MLGSSAKRRITGFRWEVVLLNSHVDEEAIDNTVKDSSQKLHKATRIPKHTTSPSKCSLSLCLTQGSCWRQWKVEDILGWLGKKLRLWAILVGQRARKTDHISVRWGELCNVVWTHSQKGCKHNCSEVGQALSLLGNKYFGHRDRKYRGWPCEHGQNVSGFPKIC